VGVFLLGISPLSTENLQETQENSQEDEFDRMIATFTIPENIDPILLEAWLRREKKAFLQKQELEAGPPIQAKTTSLPFTYATYLSMVVMMVVIFLGLLNGTESAVILRKVFLVMILFFGVGFLIGWVIDTSLHESVREMVLEVVHRSRENEAQTSSQAET
jgi:uncharacterized membrane protein YciS (DUF1049 family)